MHLVMSSIWLPRIESLSPRPRSRIEDLLPEEYDKKEQEERVRRGINKREQGARTRRRSKV